MAISSLKNGTSSRSLLVGNAYYVPTIGYLVLAGGGGGAAGGGGAGGLRSTVDASGRGTSPESGLAFSTGVNYTVTVGGGGAGTGAYAGIPGTNGSNSVFSTITSLGGGGGGSSANISSAGGCGGGASYYSATAPYGVGTAGQGYDGGQDTSDNGPYPAGGGGGTGQVGQNPPNDNTGGNGGNGTAVSITGTSVTYGGGGGGGVYGAGSTATGGSGGGGNAQGGNATVNLGGGGAGNANSTTGGNGSSGVVVIRVAGSITAASTTGSPTRTESGGYTIYKWTSSGSVTF